MVDYKDLVLQHTEKFLNLKYPLFKKKSHRMIVFNCPVCGKPSCSYVNKDNFGYDFDCKSCNFVGNIVDLVRKTEDEFKGAKDLEIYTYIAKEIGLNITTDEEVELLLNLYNRFGFDMVKIVRESKAPSEDDWVNKEHKDIDEWRTWLDDGLNIGVKCGIHSGIIIFDLDTKADEVLIGGVKHDLKILKKILFDSATLVQETQNGWHFFYKYDERFAGTQNLRKYGLEAEVRSTGGQVVLFPSIVFDEKTKAMGLNRKFLNVDNESIVSVDIKTIPDALVEYLKIKSNGKFLQSGSSLTTQKEFSLENMGNLTELLNGGDFASIGQGNRNHTLMSMGGMLRKNLNVQETENVLGIINTYFCHPSLDKREFANIMRTLNKYSFFDKNVVAQKVLEYLKMVNDATERDIREALNYKKVELDDVLSRLVRDGYLYKKNRMYFIVKKADWKDCFGKEGEKIDFTMPYFEDVATFRKGDMLLVGAKTGKGKCHKKGTGIIMSDGNIKKVEEIVPSDKIMGVDSKPRKVLKIGTGREMMYKINPCKGESFEVNENHILSVKHSLTGEITNISVKDCLKKNKTWFKFNKLYRVPVEFKTKKQLLEPYFLGLRLGDGDSRDSRITNIDKPIINYIKGYAKKLKSLGVKYICYKYSGRTPSHKITKGRQNKTKFTIKNELRKLNLITNKHIPFNYKTGDRQQRLQLLAGIIDSDGHVSQTAKNVEICSVRKGLAKDYQYLAGSLGFLSYIKEKIINSKVYYKVMILGDLTVIPTKLKRKQVKDKPIFNPNKLLTRFSIEQTKNDKFYGFELDGDHLYMIDGFIVNHNTHLAMNIIKQLVSQNIKPYYISLESGSRFVKIANDLKLKDKDFFFDTIFSPEEVELEDNAVTIIDWLLPKDYAQVDKLYNYFAEQLTKKGGILIIFAQLKMDGKFFAENMISLFPALVAKFEYIKDSNGQEDRTKSNLTVEKAREGKTPNSFTVIPCEYDFHSKELKIKV